jgi:hypothetical protein
MATDGSRADRTDFVAPEDLYCTVHSTVPNNDESNGMESLQGNGNDDRICGHERIEVRDTKRRGADMERVHNQHRLYVRRKGIGHGGSGEVYSSSHPQGMDTREGPAVRALIRQGVSTDTGDAHNLQRSDLEEAYDGHVSSFPVFDHRDEPNVCSIDARFDISRCGHSADKDVTRSNCREHPVISNDRDAADKFIILASRFFIDSNCAFAKDMSICDQFVVVNSVRTQLWRQCAAIRESKCCHSMWKWHSTTASRCRNNGDAWPICNISRKLTVALQAAQNAVAESTVVMGSSIDRSQPCVVVYSLGDLSSIALSTKSPEVDEFTVALTVPIANPHDFFEEMQSIVASFDTMTRVGILRYTEYTTYIRACKDGLQLCCTICYEKLSEITIGLGIQLASKSSISASSILMGPRDLYQSMCSIIHAVLWKSASMLPPCLQNAKTKLRILWSACRWLGVSALDSIDPGLHDEWYTKELDAVRTSLQYKISRICDARSDDTRSRMIVDRFSVIAEQVDLSCACVRFLRQIPGNFYTVRSNSAKCACNTWSDYICAALQYRNSPDYLNQVPVFSENETRFSAMDCRMSTRLIELNTPQVQICSTALQRVRSYIGHIRDRIRVRDNERENVPLMCFSSRPRSAQEVIMWLGMLYDDRGRDYSKRFHLNWEDTLVNLPTYVRLHSCNIKSLSGIDENLKAVHAKMGKSLRWELTVYTRFDISNIQIKRSLDEWMVNHGFSDSSYMLCMQQDKDMSRADWKYEYTKKKDKFEFSRLHAPMYEQGPIPVHTKEFSVTDFMWTLSSSELCVTKVLAIVRDVTEGQSLPPIACTALQILKHDIYPLTTLASNMSDICYGYKDSTNIFVKQELMLVLLRVSKAACGREPFWAECRQSLCRSCLIGVGPMQQGNGLTPVYPSRSYDYMPFSIFRVIDDDQVHLHATGDINTITFDAVFKLIDNIMRCHLHCIKAVVHSFDCRQGANTKYYNDSHIIDLLWPVPTLHTRLHKSSPFVEHSKNGLKEFFDVLPDSKYTLRKMLMNHCRSVM